MLDEPVVDAVMAEDVVAGGGEGLTKDMQANGAQDLISGGEDKVIEGRAGEWGRGGAHPADHRTGHCSSECWVSRDADGVVGQEEGEVREREGGRAARALLVCLLSWRTGHKAQEAGKGRQSCPFCTPAACGGVARVSLSKSAVKQKTRDAAGGRGLSKAR
jgi:hypothetical protein